MPLNTSPYIRGCQVIVQDITGIERAFSIEGALNLQSWLFNHNVELHELLHKPHEPMFNAAQEREREQML